LNLDDRSEIRRIDGETLRFLPNGKTEIRLFEFFFELSEIEPERKARFSSAVRQAITEHWLAYINSHGRLSRRSLSGSDAFESYHSEIRDLADLNRPRTNSPCPFEFREIAGERLRFHHPSGQVTVRVGSSYLPFGEVPPSRAREINQSVFLAAENYLRDWRRA
jgi:hypothetical protein